MKKLLLLASAVVLTVSLNSCSNDGPEGSSMSIKVDGTKKNFKTLAFSFPGTTAVHGYIGAVDVPTETVDFDLNAGTGADKVVNFYYENSTDSYSPATSMTSNVTTNSATSAKGTFSGTVQPAAGGTNVVITDGAFNLKVTVNE